MVAVAELLSLREYARRRGVSHAAVHKAAVTGRLGESARQDGRGRWLIDPELADREWERRTDPTRQRGQASARPESGAARRGAAPPKPARKRAPRRGPPPVPGPQEAEGELPADELERRLKEAEGDFHGVRAISEEQRARLLNLEHKLKSGELVEATVVKRAAARLAKTVRDRIATVASKVAALCARESDSTKVERLLARAHDEALEELADGR